MEPGELGDNPVPALGIDTSYRNVIDAQFVSRAVSEGARCVRGARWSTRALYPSDGPSLIATAYYAYSRSFEALAEVEGALAHVIRTGESVILRLAAADQATLDRAERRLRTQLPEPEPSNSDEVTVEFAYWADPGISLTARTVTSPSLSQLAINYPATARTQLEHLTNGFRAGEGGRLLLWHGPPGCGKTWALRALASEWRDWCTIRYVTDPEVLFQEPGYLVDLLDMRVDGKKGEETWHLLVLEDTGELLSANAKQETGQGLSRLLNVVDGLLGESSRALFLITTNDDLRSFHPAVARPGRCAQIVEFGPLSADEANAWLEQHGSTERVSIPATLAQLFALRAGRDVRAARRHPIGFASLESGVA